MKAGLKKYLPSLFLFSSTFYNFAPSFIIIVIRYEKFRKIVRGEIAEN